MDEDSTRERASALVIVVAGQVASGKTSISRALSGRLGAKRLEADRVRGTLLASTGSDASGAEARWRRDLSPGFEDEIYADLMRRAEAVVGEGRALVLDACFPRRAQRDAVRALARRFGVPFLLVECRTPDETVRARLVARDRSAGTRGWAEIHRHLGEHFEPPDEIPLGQEHIVVTGAGPIEPTVEAVLAHLRQRVALPAALPPAVIRPMPRAVSFDCWGTLLVEEDWTWAHGLRVAAVAEAAREAGARVERETASRAYDAAWARHQLEWIAGRATGAREVAEWALEELGLRADPSSLEPLVHRFEEASHTSRVVGLQDAAALIQALADVGVARVLVCDTGLTPGRVVRRLLDRVGLLEGLDALAFSDEVGVPKPNARAFLAALEPIGIEPTEALHVGDLRRTDVAGARAIGMRTVRIRARHDDSGEEPEADHVVASHLELAGLLGVRLPRSRD